MLESDTGHGVYCGGGSGWDSLSGEVQRTLSSEVSELEEVEGAVSRHSWVRFTGGGGGCDWQRELRGLGGFHMCGSGSGVVLVGGVGAWSDRGGVVDVELGCLGGSQESGWS